ncbi:MULTISPECIES: type I DNA topoisomerase [unclassified Fusibacter]|uniref:DNA topoisomerase family protein n=1 Tax=unclassified Fusibacter TaxID=2624464 RepID=UPI001FAA9B07|nr:MULTISPECIES: topoisomerase DNA-binding C4 zinc finger domain-containing protein [unclassified Fusibacter]MCK8058395.1 topoisomerase DNA-binding C4 zinc finger domain-containing protein [Fusibacter sp. A2]
MNTTYVLVPQQSKSVFITELEKYAGVTIEKRFLDPSHHNIPKCPKCKVGLLVKRQSNRGNSFAGCSNYPSCDYTINDISVLTSAQICVACGGFLLKRKGKFGNFKGCSNYPVCKKTIKMN